MLDSMTTTVKATCESCGTVEVPFADVRVNAPVLRGEQTVVDFTCPRCSGVGRQVLSERATMLLIRAGVQVVAASPDEAQRLDGTETHTDHLR